MSGQTSFNEDLFAAEHLCMEDEEPYTGGGNLRIPSFI
jgi:hypothetical protein